MSKNRIINVPGHDIGISQVNNEDFLCITDMARRISGYMGSIK